MPSFEIAFKIDKKLIKLINYRSKNVMKISHLYDNVIHFIPVNKLKLLNYT